MSKEAGLSSLSWSFRVSLQHEGSRVLPRAPTQFSQWNKWVQYKEILTTFSTLFHQQNASKAFTTRWPNSFLLLKWSREIVQQIPHIPTPWQGQRKLLCWQRTVFQTSGCFFSAQLNLCSRKSQQRGLKALIIDYISLTPGTRLCWLDSINNLFQI